MKHLLYFVLLFQNDIKNFFKDKPKVTLKLEHGEGFNLDEYFDVKQNAWQTEGIDEVLDKAVGICKGF